MEISAFSDEVFRYTRDMHTVWRWLQRYRGEGRCIAQSLLTRLRVSHGDEYNHNVDSTTYSWQRCTRDSKTRDSYTRNNSRVCWQHCTDAVNVLCTFTDSLLYTCTVAIHNIDATCRKNRWNFIVKTKFCQIFDNLRHVSAWNTILLKHHCQNDVWNDLRHLAV